MPRLPSSSLIGCTTTARGSESSESPSQHSSNEIFLGDGAVQAQSLRQRRPSAQRRRYTTNTDSDAVYHKVDLFLAELERRLDWLENYGNLKFDAGINRAYSTLEAVREASSNVSGELIDAGRRKAKALVDVLETRYNDVLTTRTTLADKAHASIRLMEDLLLEFETRAQAMSDGALTAVMDRGWRRAETGLETAREAVAEGLDIARRAKDTLKGTVEHALQRAKEHGLIGYDDLPVAWRVNPHIIKGYRFSATKLDCVRSAFTLSNESVNIWSHGLGLILVLTIAFCIYPMSANFSLSTKTDIFFAAMFFFSACKCLVCSCMWHTMNSIADQGLMERFACVDYTGISLLIAASIMTTEYTAFYCEPTSRWTYIFATAILGVGGVIVPWHPFFNRVDMSWLRVAFYLALGATGFAPVIQLNLTRGAAWSWYFYAPVLKSVAVYVVGAFIYALKLPEKLLPGWFDYFGASHNIWHIAVLGGILFHYTAMQSLFSSAFKRSAMECSYY